MSATVEIRPASKAEFAIAIEWAAQEGWNPGIDDLDAFYSADPEGFVMGFVGGKPVSSISVVRYGDDFGFLGFYIVHPDFRGQGIGLETWKAGMAHLEGRTIGLDGVVEQQDDYSKSGFAYMGRNVRYSGTRPTAYLGDTRLNIRPACVNDLSDVNALDRLCFGRRRDNFISEWCFNAAVETRKTLVCRRDEKLVGFGTIRQCVDGYKIAPLFCDTSYVAEHLFFALSAQVSPNARVSIDLPLANAAAVKLVQDAGLLPGFETARMVFGDPPQNDWDRVFGLTSFELG